MGKSESVRIMIVRVCPSLMVLDKMEMRQHTSMRSVKDAPVINHCVIPSRHPPDSSSVEPSTNKDLDVELEASPLLCLGNIRSRHRHSRSSRAREWGDPSFQAHSFFHSHITDSSLSSHRCVGFMGYVQNA